MGCLIALLVMPFRLIKWCVTNGWKGWTILGILLVFGLIGFAVIRSSMAVDNNKTPTTEQHTSIPMAKDAPFIVTTSSRTYYAVKTTTTKEGEVMLTGYWEVVKGQWVKNVGILVLDQKTYGKVSISKR